MKITNVRVKYDKDTFAPVVRFEGEIPLEITNTHTDEVGYIHDLGLKLVSQVRNELAKQR